MAKTTLTFEVDDNFIKTLDELKTKMGARDRGEALTLSLAVAKTAAANTDADNVVTITDGASKTTKLKLTE